MSRTRGRRRTAVLCGALLALAPAFAAGEPAADLLTRQGQVPVPCLTPMTFSLHQAGLAGGEAARAALATLRPALPADPGRFLPLGEGVRLLVPDPLSGATETKFRRDALRLEQVLQEIRLILEDDYGFTAPAGLTVVLEPVQADARGYLAPGGNGTGPVMVLDYPVRTERLARAAAHQFVHAAVQSGADPLPSGWAEAFATFAGIRRTGRLSAVDRRVLEHRRDHLHEGLDSRNLELAAGNALWFFFLEEAYGAGAVRLTLDELRREPAADALDRGALRATGLGLPEAFREFHLWSVLTGSRSTGRHLPFGHTLSETEFASEADTFPALSVHADLPVAPLGATQVLLKTDGNDDGGLAVRFEGDLNTTWEADLLLVRRDGALHRVALDLAQDGRGKAILPLAGLDEALLLIRNLSSPAGAGQRYTWAAHREAGFPFELSSLEVIPARTGPAGVVIAWETETEQDLIGFNILRTPEAGGAPVQINPIRIPAIGDLSSASSYQYFDGTARPGRTYTYRLEGITGQGLSSRVGAATATVPAP